MQFRLLSYYLRLSIIDHILNHILLFAIMPLRKKFSCQFPNCSNGYYWCKDGLEKVQNKHFYRFPINPAVNVKWKKICGINLTQNCRNKYVCEDHFNKEDFVNFTRHALNPFVVPSELQNEFNLLPIEISTPFQNNRETINYCEQLHSVNSLTASGDLNDTSTISQTTADNVFNRINGNIASEDIPANLNVEESSVTHTESVNEDSFNISNCICEDANCQRDNNVDNDDTIVTDILTEHNEITSIQTKQRKPGFLTEAGVSLKTMTPNERKMYKIHRRTANRLSKIKRSLYNQTDTLKKLQKLYKDNVFQCIENQLNTVTQNFIDSQLRNVNRILTGRRWTEEDKIFALSIYKRSPRTYKYLSAFFQLPSPRTLKTLLSKVPFDTGINKLLLQQLKTKMDDMNVLDRYCALVFDEISLDSGFHYLPHKQSIIGFQDLGELGRSNKPANHALVLMLRGLRKS